MSRLLTQQNFLDKAYKIHGSKYEYDESIYIDAKTYMNIKCPIKNHGIFKQKPYAHLSGAGCPICGVENRRLSREDFIKKSKEIHGDIFIYDDMKYTNVRSKILLKCKNNHSFILSAKNHLIGQGCRECYDESLRYSDEKWISKAIEVHGNIFSYKIYRDKKQFEITCKNNHIFFQSFYSHIAGAGCSLCHNQSKFLTNEQFIEKAIAKHGENFIYTKTFYKSYYEPIIIECNKGHEFIQKPANHLNGSGCPKCSKSYSKKEKAWLDQIEKDEGIILIRQYRIPGTNYKADGYNSVTKEIKEFHGDYYHGNPKRFEPSGINKKIGLTYGELHQNTLEREKEIRKLGYKLDVMWEYDFDQLNKNLKNI